MCCLEKRKAPPGKCGVDPVRMKPVVSVSTKPAPDAGFRAVAPEDP